MSQQQNSGLAEHNITLRAAVMIMYCLVAAGCFGIDEMIPDGGPGIRSSSCVSCLSYGQRRKRCVRLSWEAPSQTQEGFTNGSREDWESSGDFREGGAGHYPAT